MLTACMAFISLTTTCAPERALLHALRLPLLRDRQAPSLQTIGLSGDCGPAENTSPRTRGVGRALLPLPATVPMSRRCVRCGRPALEQLNLKVSGQCSAPGPPVPDQVRSSVSRQGRVPSVRCTVIVRSLWCRHLLSISGMLLLRKRARR